VRGRAGDAQRGAVLALNISVCPCSVVFFSNSFNKSALSDE
jgi:hypothetical protein